MPTVIETENWHNQNTILRTKGLAEEWIESDTTIDVEDHL